MRMRLAAAILAGSVLISGSVLFAHHSVSAEFDIRFFSGNSQ